MHGRSLSLSSLVLLFVVFTSAGGCVGVQGGLKYEYEGRLLQADGKTPLNNATVRLVRTAAPEAPDATPKSDKTPRVKSHKDGRYRGTLETTKGWQYSHVFGAHVGPTRPPEPPAVDEVIVYVQPQGRGWTGYRVSVAAENQAEARSGVRKVRVPDLLIPDPSATTQSTTDPTTAPFSPG